MREAARPQHSAPKKTFGIDLNKSHPLSVPQCDRVPIDYVIDPIDRDSRRSRRHRRNPRDNDEDGQC